MKTNRRKRHELGEIFVEGVAAIKQALAAGVKVKRFVVQKDAPLSSWAAGLIDSSRDAQLLYLDRDLFAALSDRNEPSELIVTFEYPGIPQSEGVVREVLSPVSTPAESAGMTRTDGAIAIESIIPFVIVVDRPTNHGNLGAIIRSANAFGATAVMLAGHGVDMYEPAVIRSSMGAVFRTPVSHLDSIDALRKEIDLLRARHPAFRLIATDSGGSLALSECENIGPPAMILIGNEATGLSRQLLGLADAVIRIPMQGEVDSLNVACAASILMYEVGKRLRT